VGPDGVIQRVAGSILLGSEADGVPALSARLIVNSIAVDPSGVIYFSSFDRIRRIGADGIVTTFAGTGVRGFSGDGGPASSAQFTIPRGLSLDAGGNLYVADSFNFRVRKITPGGMITTIAGNGQRASSFACATGPALSLPLGEVTDVSVDSSGNTYIMDRDGYCVRKVTPEGIMTRFAGAVPGGFSGDGGPATAARLLLAESVAADPLGGVFIADTRNNRVRRVSPDGIIHTVAGTGEFGFFGEGEAATTASLRQPEDVAFDRAGNLYVNDVMQQRIRRVSADGIIRTVAGNGQLGDLGGVPNEGVPATGVSAGRPGGLAVDNAGNVYFVHNARIRRVDPNGIITTHAQLPVPANANAMTADAAGNLLVAGTDQRIHRITTAGVVTTIAGTGQRGYSGDGGPAATAAFASPEAVAVDPNGIIYVADQGNNRVRRIDAASVITTVAGTGAVTGPLGDGGPATSAVVAGPQGLAIDRLGNVFIAEFNHRVRRLAPDGMITTVAGSGQPGFGGDGGPATAARLNGPRGLAVDDAGSLYIADWRNDRIRAVIAGPAAFSVDSQPLAFEAQSGGRSPSPQRIPLRATVFGLAFTAVASTSSGGNWLSVTPAAASLPAVLEAAADPRDLAPGSYDGSIRVVVPAASPPERTLAVRFVVTPAPSPRLSAEPASLSFSFVQGAAPASQVLTLTNRGGGSASFTATASTISGGNWLSAAPAAGAATPAVPVPLSITASPAGLAAGTYSGQVAAGDEVTVPVTMTISAVQQTILLSQTGLTFTAVERGGSEPPQTFGVLNVGQGVMRWTARARTFAGGGWLAIRPSSGATDASSLAVPLVEVSASGAGLPAGDYYGVVEILSDTAPNSPQSVSIVLNVLPPGSNPGPFLRPTGLIFAARSAGDSAGSQDVTLANVTAAATSYRSSSVTSDGRNSFAYLPTDATLASDQRLRLVVQPDFRALQPGVVQRGAITLLFLDGSIRNITMLFLLVAPGSTGARTADGACAPSRLIPLFTHLGNEFIVPAAWPATVEARIVDDCGAPMTAGAVVVSFSNGDPPIALVPLRDGRWSGTWQARNASVPRVTLSLAAEEPALRIRGSAQLTGSLRANQNPPVVESGAVVSAASLRSQGSLAPGSIITVFGSRLAEAPLAATSVPLETQLGGTIVAIAGLPLPILYASENQVNALVPYGISLNTRQQLVVRRSSRISVPEPVLIAAAQPAIFSVEQSGRGQGVIVDTGNRFVARGNPAAAGDAIVIYCSGLGAVDPPVAAGSAAPASPLSMTANPVSVAIGGRLAQVLFAGLTPGFAGLYQVNAVIPEGVPPGDTVEVRLSVAGQTSPPVTIAVR